MDSAPAGRALSRARPAVIAAGVLLVAAGSLLWVCSEGSRSLVHVALYTTALTTGLPLGFALFGRRHGAGWVAGALLGYALSAFTTSLAIQAGASTWRGIVLSWLLLLALTTALWRFRPAPLVGLPAWSRRDTTALLLVLLLVPALMWGPYSSNGSSDASGTRYYRAYFTADFVWHMAVTGQLARLSLPPDNPFVADQTMHYYWTYFTVPAVGASMLRSSPNVIEQVLEINAVLTGLLFVSALFVATWAAVPRPAAVALTVSFTLLAASAQGWYGVYDIYNRGRPLEALRSVNIGAMTAWNFRGLRIDALPRALWWTPQHAMACALGLMSVTAATTAARVMPLGAIALVGLALGAALAFSPLLGGAFALIYGLSIVIGAVWERTHPISVALRHSLAALPVAAAFGWCAFNQMWERAGSALAFGFGGLARRAPVETLALALGPLLIPAAVALVLPGLRRSVVPHAVGVAAGLLMLYLVRLVPDPAWVGFRAGQLLQITLPGLAALWIAWVFDRGHAGRWAGGAVIALLFVAGLPTTLIDVRNAQDTDNRAMGPGFRWTIDITPEQQAAFAWIGRATAADAVVQMEPTARGRETWSLLPSFTGRRMGAGQALPLLMDVEHKRRIDAAQRMYETKDPRLAWTIARDLGIDYVYLDRVERQHYPGGVEKFETSPHLFAPVYRNDEVLIYAVAATDG